jgi:hypothetical protein
MMMGIPEEALATAESLSGIARQFLSYVETNPQCHRPIDQSTANVPPWMAAFPFPLQAWPTFVGGSKLEEIRRATVEMPRLVKSVPERIFGGDVQKISSFYSHGDTSLTELLMTPPNGIEEGLARCDFYDTSEGIKCLEVNMGGNLGGWESRFWEQMYRNNPAISRFLTLQGVSPSFHDPLRSLFEHLAGQAVRKNLCGNGTFNTLLILTPMMATVATHASAFLNQLYLPILRQHGLTGKVLSGTYSNRFSVNQGMLYNEQGERIHAVVEHVEAMTPREVYRCFKMGSLSLYNGPLSGLLGDKRNLALLSEHQDSDLFDSAERAILERHLPWSRLLVRGKTRYQGELVDLEELLSGRRESFVIKQGLGKRGENVVIGRATPAEQWNARVREEMDRGGWLVQEHISSRSYLYQHGDGYQLHDVVWGMFCFGEIYGGGFLRMMPRSQAGGVINSARGATEGLIFEV